jgi:hypothetical protein
MSTCIKNKLSELDTNWLPNPKIHTRLLGIVPGFLSTGKGPAFTSGCMHAVTMLIMSPGPVAADTIGPQVLERIRGLKCRPSSKEASRPAKYLASSQSDGATIDLQENVVVGKGTFTSGALLP